MLDVKTLMKMFDANGDGLITFEEWTAAIPLLKGNNPNNPTNIYSVLKISYISECYLYM